eukprot:CAMPEP_0184698730 /NCGR_PEP_ID=MMETSP0313-20130426/5239_1 /TAXON_ID=2792 /ORGANISM="Porphyridium aerugineum, Strain SAG 1380-2" /LENGTH=350 /DNA_ID=CAMNT_0027157703 /DNA_START=226 /DNA_END=1278 /DNA_ORIENTATION=+
MVSSVTAEPDAANQQPRPHEEGYSLNPRMIKYHNTERDAWIVYNDKVYDITLFLDQHPGGKDILASHWGTDVTKVMEEGPHKHSKFAYKILDKYQIGVLSTANQTEEGKTADQQRLEQLDRLVDWRKPLLPQVGNMGEKYFEWVHSFPTTDHTVKMFQNEVLEFLTKCPWYMPLLFWIPIACVIMYQYFHTVKFDFLSFSSWLVFGVIFWLFFEYSLHRWVFHMHSTTYFMNIIHFLIHGHHHITPLDNNRVVFPPVPALILASPIWIGAVQLFGYEHGYAFLLGFLVGYINYDMTHFWIHQKVPKSPYVQGHKTRHVYHHYHLPDCNFGISHPLFDFVFGTHVGDYKAE